MKILFLPHNFPGPFRGTAGKFAENEENKVLFVTSRSRNDVRIQNVGRILINQPSIPSISGRAEFEAVRGIRRASHMANCLMRLKNKGFHADIIIANAGLGYALYVRDVFPDAFFVCYAEGFHDNGHNYTVFSKGKRHPYLDYAPERVRNFFQWGVLQEAHMVYTSTQWQKSLYPPEIQKRISVFHEGVDANFFVANKETRFNVDGCDLSHVEELVTFSGRSFETHHKLPIFLQAVPSILENRPKCHILIMSADTQADNEQWKKWKEELKSLYGIDETRLHFINFRPYVDYRKLLQASSVHIYLSAPQALSSGIFEAMSSECLVIAGDTGPVREVINHGENGFLYDQSKSEELANTAIELLERRESMNTICQAARKTVKDKYEINKQTPKTIKSILKNYNTWKKSTT